MNLLYNTGIYIYRFVARVAALRSDKISCMLAGQARALGDIAKVRAERCPDGFEYWFHAASLGEFEQARPLIEAIRRRKPSTTICLSFFSPSGYEVRKNYSQVDCVVYLPFDTPARARTFVDAINPRMTVFVKYEFWGNILSELSSRSVPTYLISSIFRPSQIFFKPWGGQFRKILRCFSHIFLQDEDSKLLLESIGVINTTVAGDTRFDRVTDIMAMAKPLPMVDKWLANSPFTLVVGSSWPEDERYYVSWINSNPEVRVIIAPHEFDETRIRKLVEQFNAPVKLWSELDNSGIPSDARVLIIDTFGLLSSMYRYGHVAIIGGGFGAGIHNINEAAVYGIPVIFGPNNRKFREAADLIACGGGFEYRDARSLALVLDNMSHIASGISLNSNLDLRLRAGCAAGEYIKSKLGATSRIIDMLFR